MDGNGPTTWPKHGILAFHAQAMAGAFGEVCQSMAREKYYQIEPRSTKIGQKFMKLCQFNGFAWGRNDKRRGVKFCLA